jgi:hypothetical protein
MATQASAIITAARERLLVFDLGRSELGGEEPELFRLLNRRIKQWYVDASRPVTNHEQARDDFFAVTATVTLLGTPPTGEVNDYCWSPRFETAAGARVFVVSKSDLVLGRAELPPAVYLRSTTVTTAARTGDPIVDDVLTYTYTPVPGTLAVRTDYIGATTPATASTSEWPSQVGDPALIAALAHYLLVKSGDGSPADLETLQAERDQSYARLLSFVRSVR